MEAPRPLSWPERTVVVVDATLGVVVTAFAVLIVAEAYSGEISPDAPNDGWGVVMGILLAPSGVGFLLAAVGVARRRLDRWWLHLLPVVLPAVVVAFGSLCLELIAAL